MSEHIPPVCDKKMIDRISDLSAIGHVPGIHPTMHNSVIDSVLDFDRVFFNLWFNTALQGYC